MKQSTHNNPNPAQGPRRALHIYASLGGGESACLVALPDDILGEVVEYVDYIVRANLDRLVAFSAELMSTAETLLLADALEPEDRFSLAVTLIMLHGPAGRTATLFRNAHRHAGVVEIDRAANVIRFSSVPIARALAWATGSPAASH
jgi:hypothetical protein